jgi:hypothetical protein
MAKVEAKEAELRAALQELFGVSPQIRCRTRDQQPAGPDALPDDIEDGPQSEADAVELLKRELGARVETEGA